MPTTTHVGGLGVRYVATCNGKVYMSLDYHRPSSGVAGKSHWSVARSVEFDLFDAADAYAIKDQKGHWGFDGPRMTTLGADGERIALFPTPPASTGYWHGFPFCVRPGRRPSSQLIDSLVALGVLDFVIGEKLKRGKL